MTMLVAGLGGCRDLADLRMPTTSPPTTSQSPGEAVGTVRVLIQIDSETEPKDLEIPWRKGTTAFDALLALKAQGIEIRHRGSGATAFVESIDGVENTGSGRNWLFYVNEKKGKQGSGASTLQAGDVVLWTYTDDK